MSGVFIEVAVVLTGVEFAVLFLDKEEERCLKGIGGTDLSSGQIFFKEIFDGLLFIRE